MAPPKVQAYWRDSARPPRFFYIDYRFSVMLMIWMFNPSSTTFWILVGSMAFLGLLEKFGFTIDIFSRWLTVFLAGRHRTNVPWWIKKRKR